MHSFACECFDRTRGFGKAENEKTRDLFPLWSSFERLACGFVGCRSERNAQARPPDLHALPDARTGEGIPHEPLPHQAEADRDGTLALPDGTADQDLVPESADEVEKGAQDGEHEHCTVPHVALRPPLPVRAPPRPVRTLGHIGRVLARRARSTRCPVPRDVRRAELLKRLSSLLPLSAGLGHRHDSYVTGRLAR